MLSSAIGTDLQALHDSHRKIVKLHFGKIKSDINNFVDDVYTPYVINFTLKIEMDEFNAGRESLPGLIQEAATTDSELASKTVLSYMRDYIEIANEDIEDMRDSLLNPIITQENSLLNTIDESYQKVIYANSMLTGHLESIRKVKEAQSKGLELIGLKNLDNSVANTLVKVSKTVSDALEKAKDIDVKSDEAITKFSEIIKEIKNIQKN
jgi:hypothetical protein